MDAAIYLSDPRFFIQANSQLLLLLLSQWYSHAKQKTFVYCHTFVLLHVMQNSKTWLKLWDYKRKYFAFIYLSTKWVDLRDTGNKLLLSVDSMIAAFVIYFCEQNWRGGIFFSSCLIFFLRHFSNILVNFPLHLFIIVFTSPALFNEMFRLGMFSTFVSHQQHYSGIHRLVRPVSNVVTLSC